MSIDSQFAINHLLRSRGFASLAEAGALMGQLAFCVRDDRHFRSLINACEPEERRNMYDALAPNLRFKARPFADYLIELARDAECQQLPTIGEDGHFRAFNRPEIVSEPASDAAIATAAVAEVRNKERLWVVCTLCTREDVFRGATKDDAVAEARKAGWRMALKQRTDSHDRDPVEVCPRCVKQRAPRLRAA